MKRIVTALIGMDGLKFGMTIEETRAHMAGSFKSFERRYNFEDPDRKYVTDAYDDQGVYCLYSPEGHLEAISLFPPARPVLGGIDVMTLRMSEAIAVLKEMDSALAIDSAGAVSGRFSLGAFESTEAEEGEDALIDNFVFGRAGYYT